MPEPTTEINWRLIQDLAVKPHKHLNIVPGADYRIVIDGVPGDDCNGTNEVMQEARTVHHLLDLVGIPEGNGYSAHVDARVYLAIRQIIDLRDRLGRISGWHARETGPAGTVGDYCTECEMFWPCDTRRMADGTYVDEPEAVSSTGGTRDA